MAIYAVHLATGHTLASKAIKSSTIGAYCHAAATFIRLFDPTNRDARKSDGTNVFAPCFRKVLDECKRWESMPNRREGYTIQMQLHLLSLSRGHSHTVGAIAP